ncbi:C-C motif chemokine 17, partial [Galemys pyrenaicus]
TLAEPPPAPDAMTPLKMLLLLALLLGASLPDTHADDGEEKDKKAGGEEEGNEGEEEGGEDGNEDDGEEEDEEAGGEEEGEEGGMMVMKMIVRRLVGRRRGRMVMKRMVKKAGGEEEGEEEDEKDGEEKEESEEDSDEEGEEEEHDEATAVPRNWLGVNKALAVGPGWADPGRQRLQHGHSVTTDTAQWPGHLREPRSLSSQSRPSPKATPHFCLHMSDLFSCAKMRKQALETRAVHVGLECCLEFNRKPIPLRRLVGWGRTSEECSKMAILLITAQGRVICSDPKDPKTKRALKYLQRAKKSHGFPDQES